MATYLYCCEKLEGHGEFEWEHSMSTELTKCPHCEKEGIDSPVKRLINFGGGLKVELTGQDLVNKCKEDAKKMSKEMHSNEQKYANFLGPDKYQALQNQMDRRKREKY